MPASTKGQIQIGETIAVILIFMVMMIFGLYWFTSTSAVSGEQQVRELQQRDLLETAKRVMNLPELRCSQGGVSDSTCLDMYRLQATANLIDENNAGVEDYYRRQFIASGGGNYKLNVTWFFPQEGSIEVFDFHQNDPAASRQAVSLPAIVYDPVSNQRHFGVMILTQEAAS